MSSKTAFQEPSLSPSSGAVNSLTTGKEMRLLTQEIFVFEAAKLL
jgi:hypothetical protein